MPRPSTFTDDLAAQILGARRVGAPLRKCVAAAGVSWSTFCTWLDRGRKLNEAVDRGEDPKRNALDDRLMTFATAVDKADADFERVLYARAVKGTEDDARLAFDMIRWRAAKPEREAKLGLLRAQRDVEQKRAKGEHVERVEVRNVSELSDAELLAEAERLQRELQQH